MENIEITTKTSTVLDTNLVVVLEESASSLTQGCCGGWLEQWGGYSRP
ncbi:hypothetical protein [Candidatus Odyssella thessalonicensis]|nr:hypothetical protein [Candidatus Odyssella thessalonicensis]